MPTSATRWNSRCARLLAAAALAWAGALPAHAGLFDDEEARRRIDALRDDLAQQSRQNTARIENLEKQIRNIGVVELLQQIEQLNAEIAKLRGQLEVLANDNQQIRKRQRDFYLDLDSRLKRLETAAAGSAPGSAPGAAGAAPAASADASGAPAAGAETPAAEGGAAAGGDAAGGPGPTREDQAREMKAYDAASNLFRRNDFPSAIDAFRAFLKDHPSSQLAPNAEYWIGISYANVRDYRKALAAQQSLIATYPRSAKVPDALLAIAAIQLEQGDAGSARNTLEDIVARYPGTEAAGKARTRLAALRR